MKSSRKDRDDEITNWKIEVIEEDNWNLGIYFKKMDRDIVPLQTTIGGFG